MDTALVLIVVALVVIVAGVAAYMYQQRRTKQLRERFGPEYGRTLEEAGDRRAAERDLHAREKRRSNLDIHPLSGESAERYRDEWNSLQSGFVDEPGRAVEQADRFVVRIMRECGYPIDEFDQRVDDISVDHPEVAQKYRSAHLIAVAQSKGEADTEQLRQAVTAYRRLVDVLLGDSGGADGRHPTERTERTELS